MEIGFLSYLLFFFLSLLGFGSYDDIAPVSSLATTTAIVTTVVDGDTIRVRPVEGGEEEIVRYIGIDTPEPYRDGEPACGAIVATEFNERLVSGQTVTLVPDAEDKDKYDRLLRYVYVGDVFVNEMLVREGYARTLTIPPNTRYSDDFFRYEAEAISANRGIWATCTR